MTSTSWFESLLATGQHAAQEPVVWISSKTTQSNTSDGQPKLLIYPRAGRIIACQLPGISGNLFYHHTGLQDPRQAVGLLAQGGGIGGDRLWIAPESAYMWKDLASDQSDLAGRAVTPPAMDPADYRILRMSDTFIELQTLMTLHDYRCNQSFNLRVRRSFESINPPDGLPDKIASSSFAIQNELTLLETPQDQSHNSPIQAGCWDLLQLPTGTCGGTLICPTLRKADPLRSYYEPCQSHVQIRDNAVLFKIDAKKRVKIGLSPALTTGHMGYYQQQGQGISSLIVRQFLPCPGQHYIDLPVDEILQGRRTGGDALQAYNHDDSNVGFGEMEYHDPAVLAGKEPLTRVGRSVTHVLAGPDELIVQWGRDLLGVDATVLINPS